MSANAFSTNSMTWSRWATRSAFVARPAVLASMSNAAQNCCHRPSLPTAICTEPSAQRNSPYGEMDGWWLPWAWPTSPATVHRVPWKACTPTMLPSSEVRTS